MPLDLNFQSGSAEMLRQHQPDRLWLLPQYAKNGLFPDLSDVRSADLTSALPKNSSIDWSKTYAAARESLAKELSVAEKATNKSRSAHLRVASAELELLDETPKDLRQPLIAAFRKNDEKCLQSRSDAEALSRKIDLGGFELGADEAQNKVIADVDAVDIHPLLIELRGANKALAGASDPKLATELQHIKDGVLSTMIAPFYERCRGASIEKLDDNYYMEEKYLKSAMEKLPSLPPETWQLQANCQFRDAMTSDYKNFMVEQNLPANFEAKLPKLDIVDHDGAVSEKELELAKATHGPELAPLVLFLQQNYKSLTEHHLPLISKDGITLDDVKSFADKRRNTRPHSARYLGR